MAALVHTVTRTARKTRRCSNCPNRIERGERYNRHSAAPSGELGNTGWWHLDECASCAEAYGRPIDAPVAGAA